MGFERLLQHIVQSNFVSSGSVTTRASIFSSKMHHFKQDMKESSHSAWGKDALTFLNSMLLVLETLIHRRGECNSCAHHRHKLPIIHTETVYLA